MVVRIVENSPSLCEFLVPLISSLSQPQRSLFSLNTILLVNFDFMEFATCYAVET